MQAFWSEINFPALRRTHAPHHNTTMGPPQFHRHGKRPRAKIFQRQASSLL